jgi:hypothetical protein
MNQERRKPSRVATESCVKRPPDGGNGHVTANRCLVASVKIAKGRAGFPQSISAYHLRHMVPHLYSGLRNACDPLPILLEVSKITTNEDVVIPLWI